MVPPAGPVPHASPHEAPPADLAVILAGAGAGARMGELGPKLLLDIGGRPALVRVAETFLKHPAVGEVVITVPQELKADATRALAQVANPHQIRIALIPGGATRQDSVGLGLDALIKNLPYIAVHDVARVLVDAPLITRVLAAARKRGAAIPALPVTDTIKETTPNPTEDQTIARSVPRHNLVGAQTPQIFTSAILRKAHAHAREAGAAATDEAGLAEAIGVPVAIVEGDERNRKLTVPSDLVILNALLKGNG